MDKEYIAHVRKNDDGDWEQPHLLSTHLNDTSKLAEAFADKFKSGNKFIGNLNNNRKE